MRSHHFKIVELPGDRWPRGSGNPEPYQFERRWRRRSWLDGDGWLVTVVSTLLYLLFFGAAFLAASWLLERIAAWVGQ